MHKLYFRGVLLPWRCRRCHPSPALSATPQPRPPRSNPPPHHCSRAAQQLRLQPAPQPRSQRRCPLRRAAFPSIAQQPQSGCSLARHAAAPSAAQLPRITASPQTRSLHSSPAPGRCPPQHYRSPVCCAAALLRPGPLPGSVPPPMVVRIGRDRLLLGSGVQGFDSIGRRWRRRGAAVRCPAGQFGHGCTAAAAALPLQPAAARGRPIRGFC